MKKETYWERRCGWNKDNIILVLGHMGRFVFGTPSLADDLPISICCAFWWYFLLSIVLPASNIKMLWFFIFFFGWCVTTINTWIFSSQGERTSYLLPPPLLCLFPITALGWRLFFCCVDEQNSCVTTDVAKKEADLRYILECKFCLRSTTIFLLLLGNLAAALLPEEWVHSLYLIPTSPFLSPSWQHPVNTLCIADVWYVLLESWMMHCTVQQNQLVCLLWMFGETKSITFM